eukprot:GEMP01088132.1.p1 GENE.GEMP01088132.1~~GEMP01088132.1.p1  ORF type:complete len:119 (-),score=13.20 GEMP01088132.1:246-602(-)
MKYFELRIRHCREYASERKPPTKIACRSSALATGINVPDPAGTGALPSLFKYMLLPTMPRGSLVLPGMPTNASYALCRPPPLAMFPKSTGCAESLCVNSNSVTVFSTSRCKSSYKHRF